KYLRRARPPRPAGQSRRAFLRNHAGETWACDFLQLTDLLFRPVFALFIVELGTRRVVHVGVTRSPTGPWTAQQLREATPEGTRPRFLVHDHDAKYGPAFDRLAAASGVEVIRTPVRAPRANAVCERFLGGVRRECVDTLGPRRAAPTPRAGGVRWPLQPRSAAPSVGPTDADGSRHRDTSPADRRGPAHRRAARAGRAPP